MELHTPNKHAAFWKGSPHLSTPGDKNHVSAEHGKGRPMMAETLLSKQTQISSFSC